MASIWYNNIPFPEDELTDKDRNFALGQFMTAWSQVEALCGFIFRELSEIPYETSSIIFDRVGTREQLEIVTALCDTKLSGEQQISAEAILPSIEKMSVLRNKIIHAGWGQLNKEYARFWHGLTSANFQEIVRESQKGNSLRERYIFTVSDLTNLTGQCVLLRDQLQSLLNDTLKKKHERISSEAALRRSFRLRPGPQNL